MLQLQNVEHKEAHLGLMERLWLVRLIFKIRLLAASALQETGKEKVIWPSLGQEVC